MCFCLISNKGVVTRPPCRGVISLGQFNIDCYQPRHSQGSRNNRCLYLAPNNSSVFIAGQIRLKAIGAQRYNHRLEEESFPWRAQLITSSRAYPPPTGLGRDLSIRVRYRESAATTTTSQNPGTSLLRPWSCLSFIPGFPPILSCLVLRPVSTRVITGVGAYQRGLPGHLWPAG